MVDQESTDLVPVSDASVTVGLGALAMMSDDEFKAKIAMLKRGQERVREIQRSLMERGDDYGVVKGIDRPFLHLPGAEKLEKFYGFVTEQQTIRFIGDGVSSPHLSFRTDSTVHVGNLDGPVIAQVSAVCNSWEAKYRYTWAKAKCPKCGREDMIKGKPDGKLRGKWWCPGAKGGCNATFEAADPQIEAPGKIENPDPWSLEETLIQMSQKRSYVAAVRRATGTSGIFTIDDDSPSVQQQAEPDRGDDERPEVENVTGQQAVQRGGRPDAPTPQQMSLLSSVSKEKKLGPDGIAAVITRLFDVPVMLPDGTRGEQGKWLWGYIEQGMSADQLGRVLETLDTSEVPA